MARRDEDETADNWTVEKKMCILVSVEKVETKTSAVSNIAVSALRDHIFNYVTILTFHARRRQKWWIFSQLSKSHTSRTQIEENP